MLCGLGLGSKPGLGLGFYRLGPLKFEAQAGQEGSGWARAEPGLDPGLGRLTPCNHMIWPVNRGEGRVEGDDSRGSQYFTAGEIERERAEPSNGNSSTQLPQLVR